MKSLRLSFLLGLVAVVVSCAPPTPMPTDGCRNRMPGDLIVTELMLDPDGTDTGAEWVEIFNTLGSPVDLRGVTITYRQGTSTQKTHTIRASVTVPARGYVALGDVRSGPNPSWVSYSYGDDLGSFSQTTGTFGIRCGMTTIHEFSYSRAARSGRSRMLGGPFDPDAMRASAETNWCDTPTSAEYTPRNAGTPGGPNPNCAPEAMVGTCVQNGQPRPIIPAEAGDLLITEVMASPGSVTDTLGEWFELYATTDVDLNGLTIATSTSRVTLTSNECLSLPAQTYNIVSRSADSFVNGGLPRPVSTFSISLSPNNERLRLVRGDAGIDEASFFASERGVSWQLDPSLLSNPDEIRASLNDVPSAFCKASRAWPDGGGDFGTPADVNSGCAADSGVFVPDSGVLADCSAVNAGDLVITEVMMDPTSTDTGNEWFEVHNTTDAGIDIGGFALFYRQGATAPRSHVVRESVVVPARGSIAVGDVRGGPNPRWIQYAYGADLGALSNSAGTVGVRCETKLLNEYSWVRTARAGRSRMLGGPATPSAARVAVEANWCDTSAAFEYTTGNTGTPGAANPECAPEAMVGTCLDNGTPRPIVAAETGDLIITEVMTSPRAVSDAVGEWFELYATTDVDLNGTSVATATSRTTLQAATCIRVPANTYAIVARNADPFINGALPPVATTTTLSMAGGADQLRLFRGDAGIDDARYFMSAPGASWQLPPELLADPMNINPTINDQASAFCLASMAWPDGGGDFGTPAAVNAPCAVPPDAGVLGPNDCFDTTTMMSRPIERPVAGDLVITEVMARPAASSATTSEWFEVYVAKSVDLNGVVLANGEYTVGSSSNSTALLGANCRRVQAGSYLVFARSDMSGSNGGLPAVEATFTFGLVDSTPPQRSVRVFSQNVELDRFTYAASGTAPSGASVQLNAGLLNAMDNDNPMNLCTTPATTPPYGAGDKGTPAAANVTCQ